MAIVIKVWYLQFDKDAVWQKMVNLCRKLAAFRQKNQANLMFCARFPLSLQKKSCTRQFENKFSLRSFALSLQKKSCTRQFENKFSLRSFALSLQKKSKNYGKK